MNVFYNYFNKSHTDCQILEPMCCMIRLAMLSFKDIGTKISINNHTITIVDNNILQGPVRWTNGDNREHLHNLLNPITKATQWYDIANPHVLNIYKYANTGLSRLKTSYNNDSSIICHSLTHYISIINNALAVKPVIISKPIEDSPKVQDKKQKRVVEESSSKADIIDEEPSSILYKKLKELWTDDQLLLINTLLNEANANTRDANNYLIAIDTVVKVKEATAYEIIMKSVTTL